MLPIFQPKAYGRMFLTTTWQAASKILANDLVATDLGLALRGRGMGIEISNEEARPYLKLPGSRKSDLA